MSFSVVAKAHREWADDSSDEESAVVCDGFEVSPEASANTRKAKPKRERPPADVVVYNPFSPEQALLSAALNRAEPMSPSTELMDLSTLEAKTVIVLDDTKFINLREDQRVYRVVMHNCDPEVRNEVMARTHPAAKRVVGDLLSPHGFLDATHDDYADMRELISLSVKFARKTMNPRFDQPFNKRSTNDAIPDGFKTRGGNRRGRGRRGDQPARTSNQDDKK